MTGVFHSSRVFLSVGKIKRRLKKEVLRKWEGKEGDGERMEARGAYHDTEKKGKTTRAHTPKH